MKTTTLLAVAAMLCAPAMAADQTSNSTTMTNTTASCQNGGSCTGNATVTKNDKGAYQYGGDAWADIETVTVQAANGDPIAQYVIAWVLDEGAGVPQDKDAADNWYKKAATGLQQKADQGDASACKALATMYKEGKGVPQNETKARELADKAEKADKN